MEITSCLAILEQGGAQSSRAIPYACVGAGVMCRSAELG